MECQVLKCAKPGPHAYEMPKHANGERRGAFFLCPEHFQAIMFDGAEWRLQIQGLLDPATRRQGIGNVVLMGDDLLALNEWVVDHFEGFRFSDLDYASDPPVEATTAWTIVARRRGTPEAEPIHLVLTQEQFSELIAFQG